MFHSIIEKNKKQKVSPEDIISSELKQAAAGMRLSFRVIINISFVKFCLFSVIFLGIVFASSFYSSDNIESIFNILPYLILGIFTFLSLILFIVLGIKFKFKILRGIKLFLFSHFNITVWTIVGFCTLGYFIHSAGVLPKIRFFDVSLIFLIFVAFCFNLLFVMYFKVKSQTLIIYSANILEKVLDNWGEKYISTLEKRKLFNALNIAYETYVKEMERLFGKKTVELLKCNEILKLTLFLTVIDNNDKNSLDDMHKILKKLESINPAKNPTTFIETMDNINTLTQKHNIKEPPLIKKSKIYEIGKYVIVIIYLANVLRFLIDYLI